MEDRTRVAILEDDETYLAFAASVLSAAGHSCHGYALSEDLLFDLNREQFDIFVLDWMLPDLSGLTVLSRIRQEKLKTPVLFMTARDSEVDVVQALEAGADDYLCKPIRATELVARVNSLLRRARARPATTHLLEYGPFQLDSRTHTVYHAGNAVALTEKEFELALLLLRNLGTPLSRADIQESIWGRHASVASRTLDTHISRVRAKLRLQPEYGFQLETIYAYGYRLEQTSPDNAIVA